MSTQQISTLGQTDKVLSNNGSTTVWRTSYTTHIQTTPATIWTINHNLGKKPSVTVQDENENSITGVVKYTDNDNLTITFLTNKTGSAYLN